MAKKKIKKQQGIKPKSSSGTQKTSKKTNQKSKRNLSSIPLFWKDKPALISLIVILIATFACFFASTNHGFVNWDDQMYVTENPNIELNGETFGNILTEEVAANIHPVTMLSLAFDYTYLMPDEIDQLTGKKAFHAPTIHFNSLLIHVINTFLVFWFIYLITGGKWLVSAFTAVVFGFHPMHVESVAWVSERKDVMYALFFMAALVAYYYYIKKKNWLFYGLCFLLFFLSCFAKAMAVVLPLIMLLYDFYIDRLKTKNEGWNVKVILEKIPFLVLSIIVGIIAWKVQSDTTIVADYRAYNFFDRLIFAANGFMQYHFKLFVPTGLVTFYPYPLLADGIPAWMYLMPVLAIGLIVLSFWSLKRTKVFFFGFWFFILAVSLVIQVVNVGDAMMADRYTYVPYIGLGFILGYGIYHVFSNKKLSDAIRYGVLALAGIYVVAMWILAFQQTKTWENSGVLWSNVVDNYPKGPTGYHNLGHYYRDDFQEELKKGKTNLAEIDKIERLADSVALYNYNKAISLKKGYTECLTNRGAIYRTMGAKAVNKGIQASNQATKYHFDTLANAYFQKAISDYDVALKNNPEYYQAISNRANVYFEMRNYDKAIEDYNQSLTFDPNNLNAITNRAASYLKKGERTNGAERQANLQKAIQSYDEVLQRTPGNSGANSYKGYASFLLGNYQLAIQSFTRAIQLNPNDRQSYFFRASAYLETGNKQQALSDAQKAGQLGWNPNAVNQLLARIGA